MRSAAPNRVPDRGIVPGDLPVGDGCGQGLPGWAEGDGVHLSGTRVKRMAERDDAGRIGHIPQPDLPVGAPCGQDRPVWAEGDRAYDGPGACGNPVP